jgi:hypothetical protein
LNDVPVEVTAKIDSLVKIYVTQRGEGNEEMEWRNSVVGPMFPLVRFFASICYHFEDLDRTISPANNLRTSPMFIAATDDIRRYTVCCYPWNRISKTPVFTGVPPHVLMMSDMEQLKMVIVRQKDDGIMEGMREELDRRHVGNDAYQANWILDEVLNKVHERMMEVMKSSMRSSPDPVANPAELQDFFHIEDNEDNINDSFVMVGDNDNQIATVNKPRGFILS